MKEKKPAVVFIRKSRDFFVDDAKQDMFDSKWAFYVSATRDGTIRFNYTGDIPSVNEMLGAIERLKFIVLQTEDGEE